MFVYNSGIAVASSNPKFVYFHWIYINSASGTTRSYSAPANNAKYSVSKKLIIPYVFEQILCFQPKAMSQIVKKQVVFIAFLNIWVPFVCRARVSSLSGVMDCGLGPPYHTRQGMPAQNGSTHLFSYPFHPCPITVGWRSWLHIRFPTVCTHRFL